MDGYGVNAARVVVALCCGCVMRCARVAWGVSFAACFAALPGAFAKKRIGRGAQHVVDAQPLGQHQVGYFFLLMVSAGQHIVFRKSAPAKPAHMIFQAGGRAAKRAGNINAAANSKVSVFAFARVSRCHDIACVKAQRNSQWSRLAVNGGLEASTRKCYHELFAGICFFNAKRWPHQAELKSRCVFAISYEHICRAQRPGIHGTCRAESLIHEAMPS